METLSWVMDFAKTLLGGVIGGVASGATISAVMNYRWNARLAKIAHLKEQLKDFYAPIDSLAMQMLNRYKFATESTAVCLDPKSQIPHVAHGKAIDHNNKLHGEMAGINKQIEEILKTTSHLMDPEDGPLFSQFLEDLQRVSASQSLPLDVSRSMPSAFIFRESFSAGIAKSRAVKQEQLRRLLGAK